MSGQPGDIAERLVTRLDVANHNRFEDDCMRDITYGDDGLPPQFAGGYVAWLDDEMLLTAETYDDLRNFLDQTPVDQARVVIGYVEPYDVVRVY